MRKATHTALVVDHFVAGRNGQRQRAVDIFHQTIQTRVANTSRQRDLRAKRRRRLQCYNRVHAANDQRAAHHHAQVSGRGEQQRRRPHETARERLQRGARTHARLHAVDPDGQQTLLLIRRHLLHVYHLRRLGHA